MIHDLPFWLISVEIFHDKINIIKLLFSRFALGLHLKSATAYRFVRRAYGKALPSESTLRRWCQKVDARPGFNRTSLQFLTSQAKKKADQGNIF